jgi:hypothetical protein
VGWVKGRVESREMGNGRGGEMDGWMEEDMLCLDLGGGVGE